MKTLDRYLCIECAQTLRDAKLEYTQIPEARGQKPVCDWCRRKRYGTTYRIQYGRK